LPLKCAIPTVPAARPGETESDPAGSLDEPSAVGALGGLVAAAARLARVGAASLVECFAAVPDPRDPRGVRHSVASILGLCTAAALAGQVELVDITAWVAAAPADLLAALGARRTGAGVCVAPHPDTIERLLEKLDAQQLADAAGAYLMARYLMAHPVPACEPGADPWAAGPDGNPQLRPGLAVDGKALRGAVGPDGQIPYQLSVATHGDTVVVGERAIGPKSNEVPAYQPLLRAVAAGTDLTGWVLTQDAGHTNRATARFVVEELHAHYVMIFKGNTPKVYARLDALPWQTTPIAHTTVDTGHGRRETRTIRVLPAPEDLDWPHARQVFLLERTVERTIYKRDKKSKKLKKTRVKHCVAALGVTSMDPTQAGPEHLMTYVRGHWAIENKIHWVRDVTFSEDKSRVRTGSRPRVMTTLRHLVIGLIRQAGYTRIAATIRKIRNSPHLIYALMGLPATSQTTT
jgi:predicted transposase YbfD/YdcC